MNLHATEVSLMCEEYSLSDAAADGLKHLLCAYVWESTVESRESRLHFRAHTWAKMESSIVDAALAQAAHSIMFWLQNIWKKFTRFQGASVPSSL